jgi:hypothetical protein
MQEDVHIAETVLKAELTTPFPGGVWFERECRWVIRLEIAPAKSGYEHNEAFAGQTKGLGHSSESEDELQEDVNRASRHAGHYSDLRHYMQKTLPDRTSLQKRKVSGPVIVSQAFSPKRRRYENTDDSEDDSWNDVRDAAWTPLKACQDSACLFIPSVATADSDMPATRTVEVVTDRDVLQQQQIMRNYEEFAGQKSRKEAGLVSLVSEGERRVFESIFLNGGEVWSPATEGSGLDFDSMMGEV